MRDDMESTTTIGAIVLDEIRILRSEFANFKDDVGDRVAKLEAVAKPTIIGNGRPPQIQVLDERVGKLEKLAGKVIALGAAAWGVLELLSHFAPSLVHRQ